MLSRWHALLLLLHVVKVVLLKDYPDSETDLCRIKVDQIFELLRTIIVKCPSEGSLRTQSAKYDVTTEKLNIIGDSIRILSEKSNKEIKKEFQELKTNMHKITLTLEKQIRTCSLGEKKQQQQSTKCLEWKRKLGDIKLEQVTPTHVYFVQTTKKLIWRKAIEYCQDFGLQLAHLNSVEKMQEIVPFLAENDFYWVFASDIGQKPGDFVWSDHTKVSASGWDEPDKEPDSFGEGKETCVFLGSKIGKFRDYTCDSPRFFICEVNCECLECL